MRRGEGEVLPGAHDSPHGHADQGGEHAKLQKAVLQASRALEAAAAKALPRPVFAGA